MKKRKGAPAPSGNEILKLKRELDNARRELKQFKKKPTEALIVRDSIEAPEMIRRAEPALRPTEPNRTLIVAGASLALFLILFGAMLITARRKRARLLSKAP